MVKSSIEYHLVYDWDESQGHLIYVFLLFVHFRTVQRGFMCAFNGTHGIVTYTACSIRFVLVGVCAPSSLNFQPIVHIASLNMHLVRLPIKYWSHDPKQCPGSKRILYCVPFKNLLEKKIGHYPTTHHALQFPMLWSPG